MPGSSRGAPGGERADDRGRRATATRLRQRRQLVDPPQPLAVQRPAAGGRLRARVRARDADAIEHGRVRPREREPVVVRPIGDRGIHVPREVRDGRRPDRGRGVELVAPARASSSSRPAGCVAGVSWNRDGRPCSAYQASTRSIRSARRSPSTRGPTPTGCAGGCRDGAHTQPPSSSRRAAGKAASAIASTPCCERHGRQSGTGVHSWRPVVEARGRCTDSRHVFDVNEALHALIARGGSDLHIKAGNRPLIRVDGLLQAIDPAAENLSPADTTTPWRRS